MHFWVQVAAEASASTVALKIVDLVGALAVVGARVSVAFVYFGGAKCDGCME